MKLRLYTFLYFLVGYHFLHGQVEDYPLHAIIINTQYSSSAKIKKLQELLEDNNISINMQDAIGRTPLNFAIYYKVDPKIIDFLLSKEPDINIPDKFNITPLHRATQLGQKEVVAKLLDLQADQRWQTDSGDIAANFDYTQSMKALFAAHALQKKD